MGLPQCIPVVFSLGTWTMDHFDGKLSRLAVVAGQCAAQDSGYLLWPVARFPFVIGCRQQEEKAIGPEKQC